MVRVKRIIVLLSISSIYLFSDTTNDDAKFIFESGIESFNYELKSNNKIFTSETEGANLYNIGLKLNVYDSDILEFSKYSSINGSAKQEKLLSYYEENKEEEPFFEGYYLSMQLFALYDYLFSTHNTLGNGFILDYRKNTYISNITTLGNIGYGMKIYSKDSKFQVKIEDEIYRFGVYSKYGKVQKSSHWMSGFFGSYVASELYIFKQKYNRPLYTGFSGEGIDLLDNAEVNSYGLSIKISPHYKLDNGTLYSMIGWDFAINDYTSTVEFYDSNDYKYDSKYGAYHIGAGGEYRLFQSSYLDTFISANLFYTSKRHTFENTDTTKKIEFDDSFYGGNFNIKLVF